MPSVSRMVPSCRRCRLSEGRKKIVLGEGPVGSPIAFIGEAPGAQEDSDGRPFVGRAGKLLDKILVKHGVRRDRVFVSNIVRCRPPRNRRPKRDEMAACSPILLRELSEIKPRVVMTLGGVAFSALTGLSRPLKEVVGERFHVDVDDLGITVIPNYHPAAAMRNRAVRSVFERIIAENLTGIEVK